MPKSRELLTKKQKKFCEEYIIDGNGTQACIRSGYSARCAKEQATRMLTKAHIQKYLAELRSELKKDTIASAQEVRERLTKFIRGEEHEECLFNSESGIQSGKKQIVPKDKLKAMEILIKLEGWDKPVLDVNINVPQILDDL